MSYVLLGEFDIDEGSILKHQYPEATGADEHLLAELMLPDGAHSRSEDWTIFYLNQTEAVTCKDKAGEGPQGKLLYVLNLVRTKKDDKVRRGALVKALGICSPEPYVQIYKPLLLLALEDYFNNPSIDVLATLYNSVKAMDLSLMPRLTHAERLILRCSERKDLFEDRFPDLTASTASDPTTSSPSHSVEAMLPSPPMSDGNEKPTRSARAASQSSRKGSVTSFETSSSGHLDRSTGSGSTWVRPRVPSGSEIGSARRPDMPTFGSQQSVKQRLRDTHFFETRLTYNNINLPIRVPVGIEADEVGDYSLINLIQVFNSPGTNQTFQPPFHPHLHTSGSLTPPVILLFNAMLTGKRIVFLGSSLPANQVAHLVLAACALGSGGGAGLLRGLTERCFPYSNLTNRGNHEAVPGYIAGVTNPRFEAFTNSYDVFCNIDTGKITVSKDIPLDANRATPPSSHSAATSSEDPISPTSSSGNSVAPWEDQVRDPKFSNLSALAMAQTKEVKDASDLIFIEEIHNLITAHAGETVIRAKFLQYLGRILRIAAKYEEEVYGSTALGWMSANFSPAGLGSGTVLQPELGGREVVSNAARIEGWRVTKSYQLYRQDVKDRLATSSIKSFDLHHQLARLRYSRNVPRAEVEAIFTALARSVKSDVQIIELLSLLPAHAGGLLPLAFGLFHPNQVTRDATVELFLNIEAHPVGVKFIASLNAFHKLAFGRLARDRTEATPMLGSGRLA